MSKYVRIDNGVYKVGIDKEAKESGVSNYYYIEVDKGVRLTFDEEELNKGRLGDTIEELCDEAVYFGEKGIPHYESCTPLWDVSAMFYKNSVRYCIFTDTGIIYVAKYNKDGELELI